MGWCPGPARLWEWGLARVGAHHLVMVVPRGQAHGLLDDGGVEAEVEAEVRAPARSRLQLHRRNRGHRGEVQHVRHPRRAGSCGRLSLGCL
jgi:hypothetical protein